MNLTFLSKEDIYTNIGVMKMTIEQFASITDNNSLIDYLSELTSLQALATETYASVQFRKQEAIKIELDNQLRYELKNEKTKAIPPSVAKMRAESNAGELMALDVYAERLCRNISHSIDAVRTKISYIKQELNTLR